MESEIINKVASSGIITIDLSEYLPLDQITYIDMKDHLFQGLILREKDFREFIKTNDWSIYQDKIIAVHCTADAIIPTWAYMLLATALSGIAKQVYFGLLSSMHAEIVIEQFSKQSLDGFKDQRVVIKGCGDIAIGEQAFLKVTYALKPLVKALMYGEPCSTVPIFKNRS